jgi:DNA polymerase III subunit epsilon
VKLFSPQSWRSTTKDLPPGPVRDYLVGPKPTPDTLLAEAPLLAVDVETTGLDPRRDQILSIGFVPLDGLNVRLAGAGHVLVRPSVGVGDSANIHGLTDDALADALSPAQALDVLFSALRGRVLLAHHAGIETGFVGRACNDIHGFRPRLAVVDTMALQFRLLSQGFDDEPPAGSLRLWTARGQYGLPRYAAHNALTDSLACAELYLAQAAELQALSSKPLTLKSVLKY